MVNQATWLVLSHITIPLLGFRTDSAARPNRKELCSPPCSAHLPRPSSKAAMFMRTHVGVRGGGRRKERATDKDGANDVAGAGGVPFEDEA